MTAKFCSQCAAPLTWQQLADERHPQAVCTHCGHVEWQNPKPTVSILLVRRPHPESPYEVLLVRRARPPAEGFWDCPGGFVDVDEHPEAAIRRELQEELGVQAHLDELVGIFMDRYGTDGESTLNLYYRGAISTGIPTAASDVSEVGWFPITQLPSELAFENNRRALVALKALFP